MFRIAVVGAQELTARLRGMAQGMKAAVRKALTKSAVAVKGEAQLTVYKGHGAGHLYKGGRTPGRAGSGGDLRRSITHEVHDDYAEVGTNLVYARVHELGATIKAKKGPYLWFWVADTQVETPAVTRSGRVSASPTVKRSGWHLVHVKQVVIPPRPFLGPALRAKQAFIRETFRNEVYTVLQP